MEQLLLASLQQHSPASKFSSQILRPNGSLCFDKIGVDAKKANKPTVDAVAAWRCCRAAIPESEDVQKEEEEEEEESRGISKAFSFVKNQRLSSLRAAFHETSSSPAKFVYPPFIHEGRTTHLSWQCRDV
ncbi:hypothetical protein COP2_028815 [Malus domestica]